MIKEIIIFTVVCDNCGVDSNEDAEYSGYGERNFAEEMAAEIDWQKVDGKHYCPDCFSWDDDDNPVIDLKRKKNGNSGEI